MEEGEQHYEDQEGSKTSACNRIVAESEVTDCAEVGTFLSVMVLAEIEGLEDLEETDIENNMSNR